ncbi:MAG TPA: hypothetical protein PLK37_05215 [Terricaulis sp.]|nr:hypothetical protein [Terricaulis sp.]
MKTKGVLVAVAVLAITGVALAGWVRMLDPRGKAVAGEIDGAALVLNGRAFGAPDPSPEQTITTSREGLTIQVLANQPPPSPADRGVRILLAAERAGHVNNRAVIVDVAYTLPRTNPATHLAVSLQGIEPSDWETQALSAAGGRARFALDARLAVDALGLRAINETPDAPGAVVINDIRIMPAEAGTADESEAAD